MGCWHYESPKKKIYKKIEEPCEQKLQGALFLAIENKSTFSQLSIPAPILTTMTKSEPVISMLEKKPFYGKLFLPLWLAGFLSSACKLEFLVFCDE